MSNSPDKQNDFSEKSRGILAKALNGLGAAKDWVLENRKISLPVGAVLIVALIVLAVALNGRHKEEMEAGAAAETEAALPAIPVPEVPLEENAHPEINRLMETYFAAMADGDMDTLLSLKNYIEEAEQIRIEKKSKYIESYDNIVCYTKAGLAEGSYLVYVYSDAKFYEIETPAPTLYTFVVFENEEGECYIYEGELDDNVAEYLKGLSAQDDVTNLCNIVEAKYNEAIASDEVLSEFMLEFPDRINQEQGETLAEREIEKDSEESEEPEEAEAAAEPTVTVKEVETIDTVNVRSSDSEIADKLGKVETGTRLPLLEKKENGWTKVEFEGQEAYIKSEFLADVVVPEGGETETDDDEGVAEVSASDDENTSASAGTGGGLVGSDGKVRATTTVNVRASANENGEKLGVIYQGETLELIMQQADGWCKVKYQGKTGYVKTEFME